MDSALVFKIVFGALVLFWGVIYLRRSEAWLGGLVRRARRGKIGRTGVRAPAKVVDVQPVDPDLFHGIANDQGLRQGASDVVYRVLVMVHPDGFEPFAADFHRYLSPRELDQIRPDAEVVVRFDPKDTEVVVLDEGGAQAIDLSGGP